MRVRKLEARHKAGNCGVAKGGRTFLSAAAAAGGALVPCFQTGFRPYCGVGKKRSLRRLHALAEKLRAVPHLDEAERLLYARGLLATPDERWMFNLRYCQLVNSWRLSMPKKSAT
jgi:hypothetical protein